MYRILRRLKRIAFQGDDKDIENMLQNKSLEETAQFISDNNLLKLKSFNSHLDLLKYSIENITIPGGLFLEFGVFKGSTINFISSNSNNTIYGFDSFEGLPEDWRTNFLKGHFRLDVLPKVNQNVTLIKGWYNETLPKFLNDKKNNKVSFLHVDCDLYSSTKTIFDNLSENIVSGTIIVFDEYWNYSGWKDGEYKAFNEFIEWSGKKFEYIGYNQKHEQVAVKIL